jgi:hypothetical protein
MSKGSKQRPTNHDTYVDNYERIFGKKERKLLVSLVEDTSDMVPTVEPATGSSQSGNVALEEF